MDTEQVFCAQGVMTLQRESDDKKEREKTKKYNSQGHQKDQDIGWILIMNG